MTDSEIKEIRENVACQELGDNDFGKWAILPPGIRKVIAEMADDLLYKNKLLDQCISGQGTLQELAAIKTSEVETLLKRIEGQKHALFEQQAYTAELQKQIEDRKKDIDYWVVQTRMAREETKDAASAAVNEFAKMLIDKAKNGVIHAMDIPDYAKEMKDRLRAEETREENEE